MEQNPHFFFALGLPQETKEELKAVVYSIKGRISIFPMGS